MRLLTLILFYIQFKFNLSATVSGSTCDSNAEVKDFYWRDYDCVIPEDAVPGGIDINGNVTYIGQVLHGDQIIPAEIHPKEKVLYELGFTAFLATKNIKILCSRNKNQFLWVATGNQLINKMKDRQFIVAGFEPNPSITLLMGRKFIDGEFVLGKVLFTYGRSVLVTTKDGKGIHHEEFDVLVYRGLKQDQTQDRILGGTGIGNSLSCEPKLLKPFIINLYA